MSTYVDETGRSSPSDAISHGRRLRGQSASGCSVTDVGPEAVDAEWAAALAHADVPSAVCHREDLPGSNLGGDVGALLFPSGCSVAANLGSGVAIPSGIQQKLDDASHQDFHRVVIAVDTPVAVIGARLRHELEHVRQVVFHPGLLRLHRLIDEVVVGHTARQRGCPGMYINALPDEHDANAAAAAFLEQHHADAIPALCGDPNLKQLACSKVGPGPIATLPARMVAHAWLNRDVCEQYAKARHASFATLLDRHFKGAGSYWEMLEREAWHPEPAFIRPAP